MTPFVQMPTATALMVKRDQYTQEEFQRQYNGLSAEEQLEYQRQLEHRRQMFPAKRAAPSQKPQTRPVRPKQQGYGRFEVLNNFVDEWASEFSPAVRAVWLHLFRHTNGKTQICDITCRQIAQKSNLSKTTVSKALGELEKKGLLIYIFRSVMNSGKPSLVRLEPRSRPVPLSGQGSTTQ